MNGKPDDDQMAFAITTGRVMYTANVRDFSKLHLAILGDGGHHPGIIVVRQRSRLRRLQFLLAYYTQAELRDQLFFLARWPEA